MSELENVYERIGFGKYQVLVILIVGMAEANDGAQLIASIFYKMQLPYRIQFSKKNGNFLQSKSLC
jgi:hypothetical protein